MSWLVRLWRWVFPPPLALLERWASEHGRVTLQHVELEDGLGWHCSIRSTDPKYPRYAWTAMGHTIHQALARALHEADTNPIIPIHAPCAPKLGGAEFDSE